MKKSAVVAIALSAVGMWVSSCQSASVEKKAEEYRRSGVARDMVEARRMAENYYWPDSARTEDYERRSKSEVFALGRDSRK